MVKKRYNVASFFSGCGGMDYGFHNDNFNILFANDSWKDASNSFRLNYPEVGVFEKPIEEISANEIKEIVGKNKIDVLIGGPPCQCFTRLNNNHLIKLSKDKKEDKRRMLSKAYIDKVKLLKPKIVLMENVKDMLVRRDKNGEYYGDIILKEFKKIGYSACFKIISMEKYSVPEKRTRVIFFATNVKRIIKEMDKNPDFVFPEETEERIYVKDVLSNIKDDSDLENHNFVENEQETKIKIKNIPKGGYYEHLPDHLKTKKKRNGKWTIVKRYGSYLRRLDPEKHSVTITKNYLIHPFKDRFLSNREKALLHGFPRKYKFYGGDGSTCQQIANSVPPSFSIILSQKIFNILNNYVSHGNRTKNRS